MMGQIVHIRTQLFLSFNLLLFKKRIKHFQPRDIIPTARNIRNLWYWYEKENASWCIQPMTRHCNNLKHCSKMQYKRSIKLNKRVKGGWEGKFCAWQINSQIRSLACELSCCQTFTEASTCDTDIPQHGNHVKSGSRVAHKNRVG